MGYNLENVDIFGKRAWADMVGLGSIGLICNLFIHIMPIQNGSKPK